MGSAAVVRGLRCQEAGEIIPDQGRWLVNRWTTREVQVPSFIPELNENDLVPSKAAGIMQYFLLDEVLENCHM